LYYREEKKREERKRTDRKVEHSHATSAGYMLEYVVECTK
jgi:hypothetical protein